MFPAGVLGTGVRISLFLTEADRSGWVVLDGGSGQVRAFAGATTVELTPDEWRYTWMPARSVLVAATACHAESDAAVAECYPLLWREVRRLAVRQGISRVTVQSRPGDAAARIWLHLGLRSSARMAVRQVATWQSVGCFASGVTVRRAGPEDVESLADLSMEEHLYHAYHTQAGTSADQSRETSWRLAAESIAEPAAKGCQLVAEYAPADGGPSRLVGSIVGVISQWNDDQVQRYILPARYGYVGLTVVTQGMRGRGVGAALVDSLMAWFAAQRIETAILHYVVDNPTSSRFWPRMGFAPYHEIAAQSW